MRVASALIVMLQSSKDSRERVCWKAEKTLIWLEMADGIRMEDKERCRSCWKDWR